MYESRDSFLRLLSDVCWCFRSMVSEQMLSAVAVKGKMTGVRMSETKTSLVNWQSQRSQTPVARLFQSWVICSAAAVIFTCTNQCCCVSLLFFRYRRKSFYVRGVKMWSRNKKKATNYVIMKIIMFTCSSKHQEVFKDCCCWCCALWLNVMGRKII